MRILILLLSAIAAHSAKLRIMALGDSLTIGEGVEGGYRKSLFFTLKSNGYDVEFVGSSPENLTNKIPIDDRHEGHGNWKIDKFMEFSREILEKAGEDIDAILLMVGSEDTRNGDYAGAIDKWEKLIVHIATIRPHTHILVSNLLPLKGAAGINIDQFNARVPGVVNKHRRAGKKVEFLNIAKFFDANDLVDVKHLDQQGYKRLGNRWAKGVQRVFGPNGDSDPPQITHAEGSADGKTVTMTFSKPLSDESSNITNFAVTGVEILNSTLDDQKRKITLSVAKTTQDDEGVNGRNALFGPSTVTLLGGISDRTEQQLRVAPGAQVEYTDFWRFIVLSDWHSAEKYVFGDRVEDIMQDEKVISYLSNNYGGEFVLIPGDTNNGGWTQRSFQKKFLQEIGKDKMSAENIVLEAGRRCYGGMLRTFRVAGYSQVLLAHGDHEAGDNACKYFSSEYVILNKHKNSVKFIFTQKLFFSITRESWRCQVNSPTRIP